uniref:Uncharacterized protein n=1 Tax=Rubinisphaera brasiliensis (strain ATCC 49424 / DSM 5305 / JCM 21570 / IAM 15109 / NBRC 103401 / IFAM 1448) TaxID=756272 RepID=F0SFC0_RUBBR|nr:hypothetical protein Plabr_1716 [Rubinisphaera brasiliensis DSM 5305]
MATCSDVCRHFPTAGGHALACVGMKATGTPIAELASRHETNPDEVKCWAG